jgi:hypothetical protein
MQKWLQGPQAWSLTPGQLPSGYPPLYIPDLSLLNPAKTKQICFSTPAMLSLPTKAQTDASISCGCRPDFKSFATGSGATKPYTLILARLL